MKEKRNRNKRAVTHNVGLAVAAATVDSGDNKESEKLWTNGKETREGGEVVDPRPADAPSRQTTNVSKRPRGEFNQSMQLAASTTDLNGNSS